MMEARENKDDDYKVTVVETFIEATEDKDTIPRETWSNKLDFILSCVGMSVGICNLWRFPYLCYKNGGGAFLIPFLIFVVIGGVPLFILELGVGQYMSLSGVKAWNICPVFQGIGIANLIINAFTNIYYILVMAWAAYYFVLSLTSVLPWSNCDNDWNTPRRGVLQLTSDITDGGGIIWQLALSLLVVWVIVYFCVWRGVKWTGKVVYFTAIFPYVILSVLLVRGLTLDGAMEGIVYYLKPDLSRLADIQVWMTGGTQGRYPSISGTSVVGGFAVFSVLGFMAKQHKMPIADVANAGPGLAFISYPNAVTQMPISPLWAALFFLMLIFLGLDCQFVGIESLITAVMDIFPNVLRRGSRRMLLVAAYCFMSFLVGLSMVSRGGMYIFQLFDYYSASGMVLLWTVFWELVAIAWVFGVDRFYDVIEMMIGTRINPYLYYCWKYLSPVLCMGLLVAKLIMFRPFTYNKTYEYPDLAQAFGIMLAVSSMVCIPVYGLYKLSTTDGSLKRRWRKVTTPVLQKHQIHPSWGVTSARHD